MDKITFLGGSREVGRLAMLLDTKGKNILMEYGIEVQDMGRPIHPTRLPDAVLLSHAHLDHSGLIPQLYKEGYEGKVYATETTLDLCSILHRDSIKVQKLNNQEPYFLASDVKMMERRAYEASFGQRLDICGCNVEFRDAGHIPGSSSSLIDTGKKRILFTGDIKFIETKLMRGADQNYKDIDILITESTYSYKNHPPREETENKLRQLALETVQNNGILLLPCFAVGRTQELLLILEDLKLPTSVDGMGLGVTQAVLGNPDSIRDAKSLRRAFGSAKKISSNKQRAEACKKPGVIITTAGMMNGGPVGFYMRRLYDRENCALAQTGYQVEGTVGRILADTGRYIAEGLDVKPDMSMQFLDLSAHADKEHLIRFFNKISPERIVLVHGDHNPEFEKELNGLGFNAHSPKNGESIQI